jgi:hypothetical protein
LSVPSVGRLGKMLRNSEIKKKMYEKAIKAHIRHKFPFLRKS